MSEPAQDSRDPAAPNAPGTGSDLGAATIEAEITPRTVVALRMVQFGVLLTLTWKWTFFRLADRVYREIPLHDEFFPELLQSVVTLRIAFLTAVVALAVNLFAGARWLQKLCAILALAGSTILCLHQGSYNDMTFVTAWWSCLWSVWYVHRIDDEDRDAMLGRAALLSRLIISVILLGGAIGKWTAEYWSGEVFFDIYFLDRDFWLFNLLRERCDEETLRTLARWYSRKVIVIETVAGLGLWALPAKWAATIAIVILTSIALLSNFLLFSVLFSLIGLAAVGYFVPPKSN